MSSESLNPSPTLPTATRAESPLLAWALAVLLFGAALYGVGVGLFYPAEFELRESTTWLHVVTLKHGVGLLDHQKLAYVNMNHGPLDALIKLVPATVLPFLPDSFLLRWPALLLLVSAVLAAWQVLRQQTPRPWPLALAFGGLLVLTWLSFTGTMGLVGRPDPTCLALLLLGGMLLHRAIESPSRRLIWAFGFGLAGMSIVLACWRYGPAVVSMAGLGALLLMRRERLSVGGWAALIGSVLAGMALLFVAVFLTVAGTDTTLYYKHFFGFFFKGSGWLEGGRPDFDTFRKALSPLPTMGVVAVAGLAIAVVVQLVRVLLGRAPRTAWLDVAGGAILLLLCATCTYAFYANFEGGGVWYFGAFIVVAYWALLATHDRWSSLAPWARALVLLGGITLLNVPFLAREAGTVNNQWPEAAAYTTATAELDRHFKVLSENTYLYKRQYRGELIDMGDVVHQVARVNFYGDAFNDKVLNHYARLRRDPPEFIVDNGLRTPVLEQVLAEKFVPVITGPDAIANESALCIRVWARRDVVARVLASPPAPTPAGAFKPARAGVYLLAIRQSKQLETEPLQLSINGQIVTRRLQNSPGYPGLEGTMLRAIYLTADSHHFEVQTADGKPAGTQMQLFELPGAK